MPYALSRSSRYRRTRGPTLRSPSRPLAPHRCVCSGERQRGLALPEPCDLLAGSDEDEAAEPRLTEERVFAVGAPDKPRAPPGLNTGAQLHQGRRTGGPAGERCRWGNDAPGKSARGYRSDGTPPGRESEAGDEESDGQDTRLASYPIKRSGPVPTVMISLFAVNLSHDFGTVLQKSPVLQFLLVPYEGISMRRTAVEHDTLHITASECPTLDIARDLYDSLLAEFAHPRVSPPFAFLYVPQRSNAQVSSQPLLSPVSLSKKVDGRW